MTEKLKQCRNGQPHWCGGVYYPIDGCVDRPHATEPGMRKEQDHTSQYPHAYYKGRCVHCGKALRDADGEDVPRDDSAAPSTPSPQPKCPTCGSVDGVALWFGDASGHTEWHEQNADCFDASCHPCYPCNSPKQEQPEAGLLTLENLTPLPDLEDIQDRISTLRSVLPDVSDYTEIAMLRGELQACMTAESALTENKDLRKRIEALESREEWLEERVMVLSAMVRRASQALKE